MATKKKMLQAAAGQAGGAALDITDVFSTYLYTGTGAAQTITNGIDLDGEGGLLWIKKRSGSANHYLSTNETGGGWLYSNQTNGIVSSGNTTTFEFQSNGFINAATGTNTNGSGEDYVSWTWRKAPKFFDCVTYTGDGANRTIAHNLGSVPGCIIVKRTDGSNPWAVYHRGSSPTVPEDKELQLNATDGAVNGFTTWNRTLPTDTVFSVGTEGKVNESGWQYVAYLFAHDTDASSLIKCGSYTGNGLADGPDINLGWQPQWVMTKAVSLARNWIIGDVVRGAPVSGNAPSLSANIADAELLSDTPFIPTSTGFKVRSSSGTVNDNGLEYIYMAIRNPFVPTITYDPDLQWSGGTAPTAPAIGETDVLTFNTTDGGTTYKSVLAIDGAK